MSVKQKLILGIAAIFMVTLTIVGITYAYFVTRVVTSSSATASVQTANIAVEYGDSNGIISMEDVMPGTNVYKAFTVENKGNVPATYYLTVSQTAGAKAFLHSKYASVTEDTNNECYNVDVTTKTTETHDYKAKPENCYSNNEYDNLYITIVEDTTNTDLSSYNSASSGQSSLESAFNTAATSHTIVTETPLTAGSAVVTLGSLQTINSGKKTYIVRVSYKSVDKNQNLENEAGVTIVTSIK